MALGALAPGYLLDTSVIIPVMANDATATARLAELPPEAILVPAVAIGELYFGAFRSTQPQQVLQAVELFAMSANVLPSDLDTARLYGRIKDELRRRGRPIPQNDIWIAAVARQHDLPLVTRDAHFEQVEGLDVVRW